MTVISPGASTPCASASAPQSEGRPVHAQGGNSEIIGSERQGRFPVVIEIPDIDCALVHGEDRLAFGKGGPLCWIRRQALAQGLAVGVRIRMQPPQAPQIELSHSLPPAHESPSASLSGGMRRSATAQLSASRRCRPTPESTQADIWLSSELQIKGALLRNQRHCIARAELPPIQYTTT